MPAKKKTSTATASSSKGRRLTPKQRTQITNAPADVANTELAEKLKTTLQTIARYRPTSAKRGRRAAATTEGSANGGTNSTAATQPKRGSIQMDSDGDFIVLRIHKSRRKVVQGLVDEPLS